jgi:Txe/YoeB family toxin of Txe-Axe toxin-antitoxin module
MKNIDNVENKIKELVEYICAKPVDKITRDDYEILKSERSEFRSRNDRIEDNTRFEAIMDMVSSNGFGVGEIKFPDPHY